MQKDLLMEEGMDTNGFDKCLERFEKMLVEDTQCYFDVSDLEDLVEHYIGMYELDKAEKVIELARAQHPGCLDFDLKQAELLAMNGKLDRALIICNRLEKLEPTNPEVLVTKGTVFSKLGEHSSAIALFKNALPIAADQADVRLIISFEYQSLGKPEKSLEHLLKALEIQPMRQTLIYEAAFCFDKIGQTKEAIAFFEQHTDKNPYCESAWYNLGVFRIKNEEPEAAIDALGFCTAIDPTNMIALQQMGDCYLRLENHEKAMEQFQEVLELDPDHNECLLGMAECFEMSGDDDVSEQFYRKVIVNDSSNADAWFGLASVKFRNQHFGESLQMARKAVSCDSEEPAFWAFLAENLMIHLQYAEAIAAYEKAIDLNPEDASVWIERAKSMFQHVDEEEGIGVMMEAIKHLGNKGELLFSLSALLLMSGREKDGLIYLEEGLNIDHEKHIHLFNLYPEATQLPRVLDLIEIHRKK